MIKKSKSLKATPSVKSRSRGRLRVESLESRQLLATVIGPAISGGENVVFQGNTYDTYAMQGQTLTVNADPGQITRVTFQDLDGDIVFAEFGGGSANAFLTVSLDNFVPAAAPTKYTQPGVTYASGNATFTISNPDVGTNFSIFTLGTDPARTGGIPVTGTFTNPGGGIANVKEISIVADANNSNATSQFGGIRAANAFFSGSSGTVGITARNVDVQGPVQIADIDASGAGIPTLLFGQASQFGVVTVAGGDLVQSNGQPLLVTEDTAAGSSAFGGTTTTAFQGVTSVTGTTSAGTTLPALAIKATFRDAGNNFVNFLEETAFVNGDVTVNLTGMTQASLDQMFDEKTYLGKVTFTGDLPADRVIIAEAFRGGVEFTGSLNGQVTVNESISGGLIVDGNVGASALVLVGSIGRVAETNAAARQDSIDSLTVRGNIAAGAIVGSETIGAVTVLGNESGLITTDVFGGNTNFDSSLANGGLNPFTGAPRFGFSSPGLPNSSNNGNATIGINQAVEMTGAIGTVNIGGNLTGSIEGVLGIGAVNISGDITGGPAANSIAKFATASNAFVGGGAIGSPAPVNPIQTGRFVTADVSTITVAGDVNLPSQATQLINIVGNGVYGNILVGGGGTQGGGTTPGLTVGTDYNDLGQIVIQGTLGPGRTTTGTINVTDNSSLHFNGVQVATLGIPASTASTIGAIRFNNSATAGDNISVIGLVTTAPNISDVTLLANNNVTLTGTGLFNATNAAGTAGSLGNVTLAGAGTVNFQAGSGFTAVDNIGTVNVAGTTSVLFATGTNAFTADTIGAAQVTGNLVQVNAGVDAFNVTSLLTSLVVNTGQFPTVGGDINTFAGTTGGLVTSGTALLVQGGDTGAITVNGDTNVFGSLIIGDDGSATTDDLGALTFNGQIYAQAGIPTIRASSIASFTVNADLVSSDDPNFDPGRSAVAVRDVFVQAVNGIGETVARNGSNLASYTIGAISINTTLRDPATGIQAPFTNTSIFQGSNYFSGLGGLGNVNVSGGFNGPIQQSRLFFNGPNSLTGPNAPAQAATDRVYFTAGLANDFGATPDGGAASRSVDFNGDGTIAAGAETQGDFTAGAANIGNVFVSALSSNGPGTNIVAPPTPIPAGNGFGAPQGDPTVDTQVDTISGDGAANGAGFNVFAGVFNPNANTKAITAGVLATQRVDINLASSVGNIQVQSIRGTLFADQTSANLGTATNNRNFSAIVAADNTGTIQVTNQGLSQANGFAPGRFYILGDTNGSADGLVENFDQLIVIRQV